MLNRRQFAGRLAISAAGTVIFPHLGHSAARSLWTEHSAQGTVDVEIAYGKLRGLRDRGVNTFKGIPYAGSVSGPGRFRRPSLLEPWSGVRDALQLGPPSIQSPRRNEPDPAEDCLFLNVWTPANDNRKRPVMFYNHGGGYVTGSGGSGGQDGGNLARNFDVVVVETNHRLGLLGFLYLDEIAGPEYEGSGNMGVLDMIAGLRWVHENIAEFGGDPENVMIFGESGGGGKTSCLYAAPEAAPYFNKASIESGPGVRMLTREMAAATTDRVFRELGISSANWKKLLEIPADELLALQSKFSPVPPFIAKSQIEEPSDPEGIRGFGPVVDGIVLPNHPFDPAAPEISRDKPLMTGWNEDEYVFFVMQNQQTDLFKMGFEDLPARMEGQYGSDTQKIIDAYREAMPDASAPAVYIAIASITMMGLGSVEIAEKKATQKGAPVYLYNFGYKSGATIPGTDFPMGTPHAMDISFKFNNVQPPGEEGQPARGFGGNGPDAYIASRNMAGLWTSFARTGKPSAQDVPEWPPYDLNRRPTMRIDASCEVINNRFSRELEMWRSIRRL